MTRSLVFVALSAALLGGAGGMVFVGSGYAISNGASGGNVLLAFGVD